MFMIKFDQFFCWHWLGQSKSLDSVNAVLCQHLDFFFCLSTFGNNHQIHAVEQFCQCVYCGIIRRSVFADVYQTFIQFDDLEGS